MAVACLNSLIKTYSCPSSHFPRAKMAKHALHRPTGEAMRRTKPKYEIVGATLGGLVGATLGGLRDTA